MGGRLAIDVTLPVAPPSVADVDDIAAGGLALRVARRVGVWASRLTRFEPDSELMRLNAARRPSLEVGPTLAATLCWAREVETRTGGMVDIALLDERLAAAGDAVVATGSLASPASWDLVARPRGGTVTRPSGLRLDLDGVAKGWLADRALSLLRDVAGAIVDADGDVAIRLAPGDCLEVGVADPRTPGGLLAALQLDGATGASRNFGIATSGITVHRWQSGSPEPRHHLIDPRTRRPARTDVLQATVLAATAREAEALAKTAVILGRLDGLTFLDQRGAMAALVLADTGECLATPSSLRWLAAA